MLLLREHSSTETAEIMADLRKALRRSIVPDDNRLLAELMPYGQDVANVLSVVKSENAKLIVASAEEVNALTEPVMRLTRAEVISVARLMTLLFETTRYDRRVINALVDSAAAVPDRDYTFQRLLQDLENEGTRDIVFLVHERFESGMDGLEHEVTSRRREMAELST
jgi:hypothetical protein